MRAWRVLEHAEPRAALAIREVETPEPDPGEVRIRVEAAGLGLPDVFLCRGSYAFRPALPFTPGQEVSGVVTAAGRDAATSVGTRVAAVTSFFRGFGGLAEEALALDAATHPIPDAMEAGEAACFTIPYHTAWLGLVTRGRLEAGETLVVLGAAGGSGIAAVRLGRALGARVIAAAGDASKRDTCLEAGAQAFVQYHDGGDDGGDERGGDGGGDGDSDGDWVAEVKALTGGRGADLVFDPVGGPLCEASVGCLASEGRLLLIGYASGEWGQVSMQELLRRNASAVGVFAGAYTKPFTSQVHEALLEHWRAGRIGSLASREVPFEDAAEALEDLAARRVAGKLVVRVGDPTPPAD